MARKCGEPVGMVEGRTSLVELNYSFYEFCSELPIVTYVSQAI